MSEHRRTLYLLSYCLTPYERVEHCGILCEKDRIIGFGGETAFQKDEPGLKIVSIKNAYALPGLIDTHVHAFSDNLQGIPTQSLMDDSLEKMSQILAQHGVTSFFPTLVSQPKKNMPQIVENLYQSIVKEHTGAEPVFMHLEGPFINPEKCGAQGIENCQSKIDLGYAKELIAAGQGKIKVMTFAPELTGAIDLIELLLENGIQPSMGHSLASGEETVKAIDAGAHRCTYIFNCMPLLFHRTSSLTSVALTDNRVAIEMIVDGIHLAPSIIDLIVRCKPADKIIGISNAVLNLTEKELDENRNIVTNEKGVISGSTMTLEHTWLQFNLYGRMDKTIAAACITSNPANDLGLVTRGSIYPGRFTDLTIFDTATNEVLYTIRHGKFIYSKNGTFPA